MELDWIYKDKILHYNLNQEGIPQNPIWLNEYDSPLRKEYLLDLVRTIGKSNTINSLIHGDSLLSLKVLVNNFKGKAKCIYIDPPYNTGYVFSTYDDRFENIEWIGMMYSRLKLLYELLQDNGVIFVQIDDSEHAYLEVLMNSVFNEENKVGTIIWRRRQSQANLSGTISTIHDYILIYAKNKNKLNNPYLKNMLWVKPSNYGYNQQASQEIEGYFGKKTKFDTPKPELLIYNILKISTQENDLVLDCFLGSGTTAAVAHKMNRKYIGIETTNTAFSLAENRITQIIRDKPQKNIGVTQKVNWNGGGGCKIYRLITENKVRMPNQELDHNQDKTELTLNWLNKKRDVFFEIDTNNGIKNVRWLKKNDILESRTLIKMKKNDDQEINIDFNTLKNTIIQGNYSQVLKVLSEHFEDIGQSQKVQCVIFAPPITFQDLSLKYFKTEQFLSFCRSQFYKIKKILRDTGFIIVHTSEPNYAKLKIVLDEIFSKQNYIGTIIWRKLEKSKLFSSIRIGVSDYYKYPFDYILLYSKDENLRRFNKFPPTDELYKNPDDDPRGPWESRPIIASEKSSNETYTYIFKNGLSLTRKFRYAKETLQRYEEENRIHFTKPKKGIGIPRLKIFFSERMDEFKKTGNGGTTPNSLWLNTGQFGSIQSLLIKLKDHPTLSINMPFRPEKLYKKLLYLTCIKNDLIIDCFSQLGTVLKCASDLNLNWIGIDANLYNIEKGIIPWIDKSNGNKVHLYKLEFNQNLNKQKVI
ncbi:MAG: DNA methyltransferase [Candidatus Hodarchaeota archaeon]